MDHEAARPEHFSQPPVPRHRPASLEKLLWAALDCAAPGLIVLDTAKRVRFVTQGASALLGLPVAAPDMNTPVMRLMARSYWLDEPALQSLAAAFKGAAKNEARKVLLTLPHPAGTRIVALDLRPAQTAGYVALLEDVTQSHETQAWLLDHASCDVATGLWNRQHFMLMLRDRLDCGPAYGTAVFLLSLKRFTPVVETLGIEAGDMLLRLVGKRLTAFLRDDDIVARFPSGEFAILLTGMPDQDALASVAARIAELLSRPYMIEGQMVTTGVYMGAASAPDDGDQPEYLVAHAGLALSAARAEAHGELRFFEPRLTEHAKRRRQLEADLRGALAHGEFEVHYQAQIGVETRRVEGFEALVRWRNPARGMVPPNDFIPVAEELGLIGGIGEWVLLQACREAARWPPDIVIAVNASPLQMEAPGFADSVARALAQSGLPGHRLEIEVTENLLLHHEPRVIETLRDLRAQGVRLVLDDFGTGYASLSQLARFRFDKIKIDRGFISAPDTTAEHAVIVKAIAALGRSLGIPTTAEGVETEQQLDRVRADGCTNVQGYLFSKPIPAAQIDAFLARYGQPVLAPFPNAPDAACGPRLADALPS
jgi:diguanylate cyclase (GGDEF)-like protein